MLNICEMKDEDSVYREEQSSLKKKKKKHNMMLNLTKLTGSGNLVRGVGIQRWSGTLSTNCTLASLNVLFLDSPECIYCSDTWRFISTN